MISAGDTQIKLMYEQGVSPEEIASELGAEVSSIKATLLSCSRLYRQRVNGKDEEKQEDIEETEWDEIRQAYKQLALNSDNPVVQEKALRFLWQEKKGRNNLVPKVPQGTGINLLILNSTLTEAKKKAAAAIMEAQAEIVQL